MYTIVYNMYCILYHIVWVIHTILFMNIIIHVEFVGMRGNSKTNQNICIINLQYI